MTNKNPKRMIIKVLFLLLSTVGTCWAGGCAGNSAATEPKVRAKDDAVDVVLEQLNQSTTELRSYQCRIEYKFSQPILESQTLWKGVMYYQKSGGRSALRINFQTLKQDDEAEEEYIEQYIFDGVWLTHIDYQIKEVKRYQQAEPNKSVDAFDLARENFPILGFSKTDELEEQFEIKLVEQQGDEAEAFVRLHLDVKPDSIYEDDYTSIEFWIDKKLYLPAEIVAISTEEDIYEIKLLDAKVNKGIDDKVFEVKIPEGFGEEIIPLKQRTKQK
ncbi:MAG: hypothetical protein JSV82_08575 [Planctomycetota bacterium]|nr:MAG: hypothetical protein JSV82_08575 [Planctomycetota bacterium]